MAPDILLFCERKKWHGRRVAQALKARGITPLVVPLGACGLSTATKTGLSIPGLGDYCPRGALVLFVPGGSFEQVTLYLGVLHALRELGVVVWNDARAIERCVDKSTTTFFLQKAGIPTPWTFTCANRDEALAVAESKLTEGQKLVQKPLFGAQGLGLRLIERLEDLAPPEEVNGTYYLQEFVARDEGPYCDWRLFVSAGRVAAAMIRHGSSWITNIKQGARAEAAIPSQELVDLAVRACACVGADFAGVDIMQGSDGSFVVLEVNSMPAWQGLQRVTHTRIADAIVAPFLEACLAERVAREEEGA
jgi:RimK family alpha-L-glutamate ligase